MRCPKCQHENSTDAKFCMECGAKLENLCYKCSAKLPLSAKFCPECGAKIDEATSDSAKAKIPTFGDAYDKILRNIPKSMAEKLQPTTSAIEGENRAISILFGDIKGSVILAEKMPPEDFADLINECVSVMVDVIWKYEGSVNRYPGDCVLAFFGTPIAHENDPDRAIFAALEMREAVTKLNLRISIGINTGMVYVGAIGPDGHRETTAMGSAVNLASRLQGAASEQQSGETTGLILVGESTYRLTRRSYECHRL
jgi:class 3 adenylate cyclase/ribosomal protein L40E